MTTALPFPTFLNDASVSDSRAALAAVGRCCIQPKPSSEDKDFGAIVGISTNQARATTDAKLNKQYYKQSVQLARDYLMQMQLDVSIVDVDVMIAVNDVLATDGCLCVCLLDAGCQRIVVDASNVTALDACRIPRDRLMGFVTFQDNASELAAAVEQCQQYCGGVVVRFESSELVTQTSLMNLLQHIRAVAADIQVVFQIPSQGDLTDLVSTYCKAANETISLIDPTAVQLGKSFAACMKTDRSDGLYTTVVCTRTGEALGLVYSSVESIVAALECGRGVYYSRSRNGLWRKGDTSGHYQTLHRLDVDCDGDALRFTVTQCGEDAACFCHLNTLTCWGDPRGLRQLEDVLKERLISAPEGSYTKRLFEDSTLLRDKLVEEAQELSEAETKADVAGELADVLYFALVQATKHGVTLDDAVAELDKRARKVTRRQGDSKPFRIAAGQAILNKTADA
jgi:phosphoribosyl-ATP pyrophosphohydrolase/phosphoribosyl-AMP cyclohydrolase/histidinol dehydrogenase